MLLSKQKVKHTRLTLAAKVKCIEMTDFQASV